RRLVAEHDAAPAGIAERPHGVPRRRDARVGEGAGCARALAQLLRSERLRRAGPCPDDAAPPRAPRAARRRRRLPARAIAQLQPEVPSALAAALSLRRATVRPAARRPRVPARRAAARPAGPLGTAGTRVTLTG